MNTASSIVGFGLPGIESGRRPVAVSSRAQIAAQSGRHDRLIGRADAIGMRGDVRQARADPIRGLAKRVVGERVIEPDNDGIGIAVDDFKAGQPKVVVESGRA